MPRRPATPAGELHLRRYPVPPAGPPLIDDVTALIHAPSAAGPGQQVLPLQLPGHAARRTRPPGGQRGPLVVRPEKRDDVATWARTYMITMLEVLHGRRPAAQLLRWSSVEVHAEARDRAARLRHAGQQALTRPPRIRAARTCTVSDDVVEVSLVVDVGNRVRAGALRVEARGADWRVTACELG